MTTNELIATYTTEHKGKLYFRVEMLRTDTGAAIQGVNVFAEVYMLRYPIGSTSVKAEGKDTSFRQAWQFLHDFPSVSGSSSQEVSRRVNEAIVKYGDDYLGKFDAQVDRSNASPKTS
jgi:hypothetical protein